MVTARILAALPALLFATLYLVTPAAAHPHVWINVDAAILVEDGAVHALRYAWRFSRDYVDGLKQEFDKDQDGQLSDSELQGWLAQSKKNLDTFKFFTHLRQGREVIKLGAARDFRLERPDDGGLVLHFSVQLARPTSISAAALQIDIYDATFFSEFALGDGRGITVEAKGAGQCTATVAPAPGGEQQKTITAFMKVFGRVDAKLSPAKAITVACKD
jgi:ABC-type uncharacterized transport system substrate-binding protein